MHKYESPYPNWPVTDIIHTGFAKVLKNNNLVEFDQEELFGNWKKLSVFFDELVIRDTEEKDNESLVYNRNNGWFPDGDALTYYGMIREYQPQRIVEIGSGHSTRVALQAICSNKSKCQMTCIEPYRYAELKKMAGDIHLKTVPVETLDPVYFKQLQAKDILFIDSSHIVKPHSDVIYEILGVLPLLNSGVLVHFHDIFLPNDYPSEWITKQRRCYSEQWFLAAFLHRNPDWRILLANHCLSLGKTNQMKEWMQENKIQNQITNHGGSLWLQKK